MNFLNTIAVGAVAGNDSALQLNNVEVLYSKVQRVYVKPQHKEERQRDLRVNVEIHAGLSPVCRKVTKIFQQLIFLLNLIASANFFIFMCIIDVIIFDLKI